MKSEIFIHRTIFTFAEQSLPANFYIPD